VEENMNIVVNGEPISMESLSVHGLLERLNIDPRRVAVELNMDILPKSDYDTTILKDGDILEIVHFVGGG
jgi:sulfur carrier protein